MQLSPPYVAFGQGLLKTSSTRGSLRTCIEMLIANEDIRGGFTLRAQMDEAPASTEVNCTWWRWKCLRLTSRRIPGTLSRHGDVSASQPSM